MYIHTDIHTCIKSQLLVSIFKKYFYEFLSILALISTVIALINSERIFYLAMQQLRLRASSSFYVEADFVKERHSKLLLVHSAKAIHHLCSPTWNTQDVPLGLHDTGQDIFLLPSLAFLFLHLHTDCAHGVIYKLKLCFQQKHKIFQLIFFFHVQRFL